MFTGRPSATTSFLNTKRSARKPPKKSAPPFDPMLDETERILGDYVSLLGRNGLLIANH